MVGRRRPATVAVSSAVGQANERHDPGHDCRKHRDKEHEYEHLAYTRRCYPQHCVPPMERSVHQDRDQLHTVVIVGATDVSAWAIDTPVSREKDVPLCAHHRA